MAKLRDPRWEESLRLIRGNVSKGQYDTWFRPLVFESLDSGTGTIMLRVPSPFVYEYIEEHHAKMLGAVLAKAFFPGVKLSYRVVVDNEHSLTQDIQSENQDAEPGRTETGANQPPTPLDAAPLQPIDPHLDPHQNFNNFVEGDSNKLSRSVGISIAEHPNTTQFNPMFIYGPSGCGKTHLINAIGLLTKKIYPAKRVLYISARLFQVQYTNAVLKNTTNDFISFYQTIDMLIVDDVQEWINSTKTQDTFFHIFNHLFRNGKRIILASDRPPVDLAGMPARLITRFSCGLIAELEKPDTRLCADILNNKIRRDGLSIPQDVVQYIARTASGSVRDLEGVLNSLMAYSVVYNSNIDLRLAQQVIKRAVKTNDQPLTVDEIVEAVCKHYEVTATAVNSRSRKREIVAARQVSMFLAQKHTKMPTSRIGRLIGGRDHSTVLHSLGQVEKRMAVDKAFRKEMEELEKSFGIKAEAV